MLAMLRFCHLSTPNDDLPCCTWRQDSKTPTSGLLRAKLSTFTSRKFKMRLSEMLCTHRVRRFVRPLKTPSAMWLIRLSPKFSFSSKPSPTKADSLRRVSWLYDRSLEALNSTSEACGGDLLWWHHQTIKYWILISNRRLIKKKQN